MGADALAARCAASPRNSACSASSVCASTTRCVGRARSGSVLTPRRERSAIVCWRGVAHRLVRGALRERVRSARERTRCSSMEASATVQLADALPEQFGRGGSPRRERFELGRELRGRRDRGRARARRSCGRGRRADATVPRRRSGRASRGTSCRRRSRSGRTRSAPRASTPTHCSGPCGTRARLRASASVRTRPVP